MCIVVPVILVGEAYVSVVESGCTELVSVVGVSAGLVLFMGTSVVVVSVVGVSVGLVSFMGTLVVLSSIVGVSAVLGSVVGESVGLVSFVGTSGVLDSVVGTLVKASRPNEGKYGLNTLLQDVFYTLHLSFKYTIDHYTYN